MNLLQIIPGGGKGDLDFLMTDTEMYITAVLMAIVAIIVGIGQYIDYKQARKVKK